jgi:chemotaxis family two-component system sensor kinase Cph1
VFVNLISNAIKFRGTAPLRVHIDVEARGAEWVFSIRDNGIGIDPKYSEKVFEMFERLHSQAHYPGTGIGLAICKKIIEGHNGRIWVEPGEGGGARFLFTLPRA